MQFCQGNGVSNVLASTVGARKLTHANYHCAAAWLVQIYGPPGPITMRKENKARDQVTEPRHAINSGDKLTNSYTTG